MHNTTFVYVYINKKLMTDFRKKITKVENRPIANTILPDYEIV